MRRLFKWAIRLALALVALAVILAVAFALLKNTLVKAAMERRIHDLTGMEARIGQVDVSVLTPMVTLVDFKIYNSAAFGGSLFLDMPELHMEYDPQSVGKGALRLTLVRLNVAEIALAQDKNGRMNTDDLEKQALAPGKAGAAGAGGIKFGGIDTLNLTLGTLRQVNLATHTERVVKFGIKNQVFHNINSELDFMRLGIGLAAQGSMAAEPTNSGFSLAQAIQGLLGH